MTDKEIAKVHAMYRMIVGELKQINKLKKKNEKLEEENSFLKQRIEKIDNKWHFIKDGDLPRQDGQTCFSIEVLSDTKKWVYYQYSSGKWFCGNKEVKVTAWQEIIFLEELK